MKMELNCKIEIYLIILKNCLYSEDEFETKNETLLYNWASESKLLQKEKTLKTSAMVQKSVIFSLVFL